MLRLHVKVAAKASSDRIVGWIGERLKIQVRAAPERGKANAAVVLVLSEALGIPRTSIRISTGASSPIKTLEIEGTASILSRLPVKL